MRQASSASDITERYSELFRDGLGKLNGQTVHINMKADAKVCRSGKPTQTPNKARTVPFAMKQQVEDELDRLQKDGVIEPVTFSRWASPICTCDKRVG